jgi:hypothetical protein
MWNDNLLNTQHIQVRSYSISAMLTLKESGVSFLLTTVYGPSKATKKADFLAEICTAQYQVAYPR